MYVFIVMSLLSYHVMVFGMSLFFVFVWAKAPGALGPWSKAPGAHMGQGFLGQGPGPLGPSYRIHMESVTTYCQADYLLSGKLPTVKVRGRYTWRV